MTIYSKMTDPERAQSAMDHSENLALLICRRPMIAETVERIMRKMAGFHVETAATPIGDLSADVREAVGVAAIVVFELDAEALTDTGTITQFLELGRDGAHFIAVTDADLPLSQARQLMKLGIDDVVPAGTDGSDFADAMAGALRDFMSARRAPVAGAGNGGGKLGTVITVARARGGLGATTVAVNLADMLLDPQGLLKKVNTHSVAIVDLDLQFGTAGTYLDLEDRGAMIEIARLNAPPDRAFLNSALLAHPNGLRVLTAPTAAMPLEAFDGDRVGQLIDTLRSEFDYVIIDLPHALVGWLEAVIGRTDLLLMVTDTSVPGVRSARRLLDLFTDEHPTLRVEVVVNRESRPLVPSHAHRLAADALDRQLKHFIAEDQNAARRAIDRGETLSVVSPNSSATKSLKRLATYVLKTFPATAGAGQQQGSF